MSPFLRQITGILHEGRNHLNGQSEIEDYDKDKSIFCPSSLCLDPLNAVESEERVDHGPSGEGQYNFHRQVAALPCLSRRHCPIVEFPSGTFGPYMDIIGLADQSSHTFEIQ